MGIRAAAAKKVHGLGNAIEPGDQPPSAEEPPSAIESLESPPWWVVLLTLVGAAVLLVMGVLVLREGREIWVNPDRPVVARLPTKESSKVVRYLPKAKKNAKKWTRPRVLTHESTVERASQDGGHSEGLALATPATGAALLLAGGFAARLKSIELPGGVKLAVAAFNDGFRTGTKVTAKVAAVANEEGNEAVLKNEEKMAEVATTLHTQMVASESAVATPVPGVPTVDRVGDQKLNEAAKVVVAEAEKELKEEGEAEAAADS